MPVVTNNSAKKQLKYWKDLSVMKLELKQKHTKLCLSTYYKYQPPANFVLFPDREKTLSKKGGGG